MGAPGGDRVGRFRVVSRLGHDVLLGEDETGRRAVVRLLPEAAGARERFRHDVQRAATAPPWFAAPVLDADPDADPPWLATAHVPGPTLARYLAEHGPLHDDGVFALATRLLDGLVALHGAGVVHHHLDPGTVLLADDGPRVTDTGITALPAAPGYRAPEPEPGPPADMYALGALLLHSATARVPTADPQGEPDLDPLTGRVRDGVLGCLHADPDARPTATQLREYLLAAPRADPLDELMDAPLPAAPPVAPSAEQERAAEIAAYRVAANLPGPPPRVPDDLWVPAQPARRGVPIGALAAVVVLVAALAAGGLLLFGGRAGTRTSGPSTPAAASIPTYAPTHPTTSSGAASSAADGTSGAVITDADADPRFTATSARFVSPSRNITCSLVEGRARCDVVEREWVAPPPAGCSSAPSGAQLIDGTATLACGPAPATAGAVLDYGTGVRLGDIVCVSQETGMACRTASGRGFRVSRASYDLD
jgi:hypothetical protein